MKRFFIVIGVIVLSFFGGGVYVWTTRDESPRPQLPLPRPYVVTTIPSSTPTAPAVVQTLRPLPAEVNLAIPFTSQAPHKNWDLPYKEFCEEASALMAASFIRGETLPNADVANERLLAVQAFEEKQFGYYENTNTEETAEILRKYYNIKNIAMVYDPTIDSLKRALADGKAVIVPAAGQQLGNPYFRSPGPRYHMLVLKGYTKDGKFITNDPGTRRGADYLYDVDVIMNAMHDWNGGKIEEGRKVVIIVG